MSTAPEPVTPTHGLGLQRRPIVAFQGERDAYADLAVEQLWGAEAHRLRCWDVGGVLAAVASGAAHFGVLPVHNAIIGEIPGVAEALARAPLSVLAQVDVPVVHCLLAPAGATLAGLRAVFSHPVALGQCRRFLGMHPLLKAMASYDTAGAAREVAARKRLWEGAIAGEPCAARYGLDVLARGLGDRADNSTRFIAFARDGRTEAAACA